MGPLSNAGPGLPTNPYCNRTAVIRYNGKEFPTVLTDKCGGCEVSYLNKMCTSQSSHADGGVDRANLSIFRQVYLHKSLMEQLQVDITTSSGLLPAPWSSAVLVKGHAYALEYGLVTNFMHLHLHGKIFWGNSC